MPHITDAIQAWVERVAAVPVDNDDDSAEARTPEVCIIELGGTIGDIEGDKRSLFSLDVRTRMKHIHTRVQELG